MSDDARHRIEHHRCFACRSGERLRLSGQEALMPCSNPTCQCSDLRTGQRLRVLLPPAPIAVWPSKTELTPDMPAQFNIAEYERKLWVFQRDGVWSRYWKWEFLETTTA